MVSQNHDQDSRKRILDAAEVEFAAKGFDGARVDAIAARAGVNKALLYYYFKSKDGLLETLLAGYLEGLRAAKAAVPLPRGPEGMQEHGKQVVAAFLNFTREKLGLMRVLLMEELKGDSGPSLLIAAWKAEWERSTRWYVEQGLGQTPGPDQDVFNFFFEDLPSIFFLLINEKWSLAMGRNPAATEAAFFRLEQAQSAAYWTRPVPR